MKRYIATMLLAALAGCSEPTVEPADVPVPEPAAQPAAEDPAAEPAAPAAEPAPTLVYDKPQLVYYRINEH